MEASLREAAPAIRIAYWKRRYGLAMWREKAARNWEATSPSYTRLSAAGGQGQHGCLLEQRGRPTAHWGWAASRETGDSAAGKQDEYMAMFRTLLSRLLSSPKTRTCGAGRRAPEPQAGAPDSVTVIWLLLAGWPPCMAVTWRAPPTAMMQACRRQPKLLRSGPGGRRQHGWYSEEPGWGWGAVGPGCVRAGDSWSGAPGAGL